MTAGRKSTQNKQDWNTPIKYANTIEIFFDNNLQLDPCSNKESIVKAANKFIFPIDGLKEEWNFTSIYINPPYGRNSDKKTTIKDWIKKAFDTHEKYNSEILMLIPVATNTSHWKEYIFGKASICFLYDTRLVFRIDNNENNKGSPMACTIIYYGNNIERFKEIFKNFGYIYNKS